MNNFPDRYIGPTTNEDGLRYRIANQYFAHENGAIAYLIRNGMSMRDAEEYINILYREYNSRNK